MTDIQKLRALLPHWIAHNAEHSAQFRDWVERLQATGHLHVAVRVEAAIQKMDAANHDLKSALQHLGGASEASEHHHP